MSEKCKSEREHAELSVLRLTVGNYLAHCAEGQAASAEDLAQALKEAGIDLSPEIARRRGDLTERDAQRPEWRRGSEAYDGVAYLGDYVGRGPDYMGYVVRVSSARERWYAYGYNRLRSEHVWLAAGDSEEAARAALESWAQGT